MDSRFSDQHIRIRCTPDFSEVYVLEKDDSLTPVRMLNKHENAVTPRKKVRLSDTEQEADDGG